MENIILVGYGGHGKSILDTLTGMNKYHILGYTDVSEQYSTEDITYLGTDETLRQYVDKETCCIAMGIGYLGEGTIRNDLFFELKKLGYHFPILHDKSAIIAQNASILEGTFIGKGAVINAGAKVGKMCILNTRSIIEHECVIGNFSHIAVNTTLCGNVCVGENVFIGAGSVIVQGIKIGNNAIIGAGSLVLRNIDENEKVFGVVK